MIVYGDPQFQCSYRSLVCLLSQRVARIDPANLDEVRTLLIQAGQLEQGISDSPQASEQWIAAGRALTDSVALAFYGAYSNRDQSLPRPDLAPGDVVPMVEKHLNRLWQFADS